MVILLHLYRLIQHELNTYKKTPELNCPYNIHETYTDCYRISISFFKLYRQSNTSCFLTSVIQHRLGLFLFTDEAFDFKLFTLLCAGLLHNVYIIPIKHL
jgi:hypothetical protein